MQSMRFAGGLCLAAIVISGMLASSAAAESLSYLCVTGVAERIELCPKGTGPFTEILAKKISFTSSGGIAQLVSPSGSIKCSSEEGSGEAEGPKAIVKVAVTYKGCKDSLGKECKTGTEAEVIKTNPISGELVDLEAGEKRVGELLRPTSGTEFFPEVKCSVNVKITGEIMGEISPENSFSEKSSLIFKQTSGVQQWRQIEEAGAFHELSAFGMKAGLENTETILYSQPIGQMP